MDADVDPAATIVEFPARVNAPVEDVALPVGAFRPPVLRARVILDPGTAAAP